MNELDLLKLKIQGVLNRPESGASIAPAIAGVDSILKSNLLAGVTQSEERLRESQKEDPLLPADEFLKNKFNQGRVQAELGQRELANQIKMQALAQKQRQDEARNQIMLYGINTRNDGKNKGNRSTNVTFSSPDRDVDGQLIQYGGSELTGPQIKDISEYRSGYRSIGELNSFLNSDNKELFGMRGNFNEGMANAPIFGGFLQNVFDDVGKVASVSSALRTRAQTYGKVLEGGKLAEGDIQRYLKILPSVGDSYKVARAKALFAMNSARRAYYEKLKMLRIGGKNVDGFMEDLNDLDTNVFRGMSDEDVKVLKSEAEKNDLYLGDDGYPTRRAGVEGIEGKKPMSNPSESVRRIAPSRVGAMETQPTKKSYKDIFGNKGK